MIDTKVYKETMGNIYRTVCEEKKFLEKNHIPLQGASENENINHLIQKTRGTSFKLLVMGEFGSGKSAFINVLLGEKILPEGALPMTALITEIYYGREKKVVMYPRAGKWKGGDEPFEIEPKLSEIKKFSTIDNKSGINKKEANRVDSCFKKMMVYWPLEILKEGVVIVDSPGLNDPYSNDHIVQNYVPKADAILFCINGTKSYSAEDRKTLQLINSNGFKNPIIVTTYFDVVTEGMEQQEIQEHMDICNSKYMNHTEKAFCHYVDSRMGMKAKQENSQSALVESGYYELEKFLTKYLTEYKGKEKIAAATAAIKVYNMRMKKSLNSVMANLEMPLADFNRRIADTKSILGQAKRQGDLLVREFRVEMKETRESVKEQMIPELYRKLYNNVNLDGFEPDTGFAVFHPKQSSQQIAEECSKEIELRNKQYVADWNNEVLTPKVSDAFKQATSKMKKQFETFSEDIIEANLTLETGTASVNTDVHDETRVIMFAYALLTGDWMTALLGGVFGASAFGRTIACEFAAGLIVGIISLFTPVGLTALVIAGIAGLLGGIGWNAVKAADSIKDKTVKETRKNMEKNKEEIIASASAECEKIFDRMEEKLRQAIEDDIAEVEEHIRIIEWERNDNEAKAAKRKVEISNVLQYLESVDAKLDSIRSRFHIN